MTLRKLMMLGGIGYFAYWHKKRGGEMSLEGFKSSGRELLDMAKTRATDLRAQAETKLHDVTNKVQGGQDKSFGASGVEDVGYGSSGYDFGRNR